MLAAIRELDSSDVDAIVQVGTNLSTVDLFPVVENGLKTLFTHQYSHRLARSQGVWRP